MKILCPTDFSTCSRQALRVAARMAGDANELVVLHSSFLPPTAFAGEFAYPAQMIQELADASQRGLDEAVGEARAAGARHVTGKLVGGIPWVEIVNTLEHQGFGLCVIGTQGRSGLSRFLLGSVAEKVVRLAPCSVLAIRPETPEHAFAHALVPIDFSAGSEHALEIATKVVRSGGALTLLHVVEAPFTGEVPLVMSSDLQMQSDASLEALAAKWRRPDLAITTRSCVGYPGSETLAAIDADRSVDVVVMGCHGRTGIKRVLLGSVAEKVVRHARCPVLVAR